MLAVQKIPLMGKFNLWQTCLLGYVAALSLSFFLSAAAVVIAQHFGVELTEPPARSATLLEFFGTVIFAPVVETILVGWVVKGLSRFLCQPVLIAGISAVLFGMLHGLMATSWFFGTVWSFFVFSYAYLYWSRHSPGKGFVAACVPHMLINLTVMVVIYFGI